MKTAETPEQAVARFNAIQKRWMELPSGSQYPEVDKVCADMATCPQSFVSIASDGFSVIWKGSPLTGTLQSLGAAIEIARKNKVQTEFAWNGNVGRWQTLQPLPR